MFILTQDAKGTVGVFTADDTQANLFNDAPEVFPDTITAGWVVADELDLAEKLTKVQLVTVYNKLSGSNLVKFQSKNDGAHRTMPLIEQNAHPFAELKIDTAIALPEFDEYFATPATVEKIVRLGKGIHNLACPVDEFGKPCKLRPCRAGTKQQFLIEALARGATMAECMDACSSKNGGVSWTEGSVKSGFYEDVNTKKGYGVRTEVVTESDPASYKYHLVYPAGHTAPLEPTKSSAVLKAEAKAAS